MTTAAQALQIAENALPGAPRGALHLALAVTRFETGWGSGWPDDGTGAHGSNNWGAVHATEPPYFAHKDKHADGSEYIALFKMYPTPEAGFSDAAHIMLKPNVEALAAAGDGQAAVEAMRANGYYEAPAALYAKKVKENYAAFLAATGEPALLSFDGLPVQEGPGNPPAGSDESSDLLKVAVVAGLALGAAWLADVFGPSRTPKEQRK